MRVVSGTLVLLEKKALVHFYFGAMFYDAPAQKSIDASMCYSNWTPRHCVLRACCPVCQCSVRTSAFYGIMRTGN